MHRVKGGFHIFIRPGQPILWLLVCPVFLSKTEYRNTFYTFQYLFWLSLLQTGGIKHEKLCWLSTAFSPQASAHFASYSAELSQESRVTSLSNWWLTEPSTIRPLWVWQIFKGCCFGALQNQRGCPAPGGPSYEVCALLPDCWEEVASDAILG